MLKRQPKSESAALPKAAKTLLFRKRTSITTLDIDGDFLFVVQASGVGSGARATRVASAPIQWQAEKKGDAAADGAAIKRALETLKMKPKEVLFSIPRVQVVLRPLQVPMASDLREMAAVVNFQISKDLPFRLEDAVVDFKVLRAVTAPVPAEDSAEPAEPAAPRLEVLVGAIRTEVLRYYQGLAREAGFKLAGVSLRSTGLAHALEYSEETVEDACLVVSIRREEISLDIISGGKLSFSRVAAVQFPSEEGAEARSRFLQALNVEVVRSLHSYEGGHGHEPVKSLFITGSTGLENEVSVSLGQRIGLAGKVLNLPVSIKKANPQNAPALAAVGLSLSALQPGGLSIDFAHPKKPILNQNNKRLKILIAATAAMIAFFVLVGVRSHMVTKRAKVKESVQLQLAAEEKRVPIYRKLRAQTRVVQSWMNEEQNWLDHLAYLSAILPPAEQLYVSSFTTTPQHVIRVSLQAKSGELLAELDKKLRAAGYEVKPLSITPANDKHGYNFRTTVELSIPKKMKPEWREMKPPPRPPDDASLKSASVSQSASPRS